MYHFDHQKTYVLICISLPLFYDICLLYEQESRWAYGTAVRV